MQSPLSRRTRTLPRPLQDHPVPILRPPLNVEIVPHLRNLRAAIIQTPLARVRLVETRARAADERRGAVFGREGGLDGGEGVGCGV